MHYEKLWIMYVTDIILIIYSSRCGHCKKIAPEFDKAATPLKYNDPPIVLAKVSSENNPKINNLRRLYT